VELSVEMSCYLLMNLFLLTPRVPVTFQEKIWGTCPLHPILLFDSFLDFEIELPMTVMMSVSVHVVRRHYEESFECNDLILSVGKKYSKMLCNHNV
jgi:hypothetical protein